jgi:hypothetical protein
MENASELYKKLEKEVDDLVNDLEQNINNVLKSTQANRQNTPASKDTAAPKPNQNLNNRMNYSNLPSIPRWRGLRGLGRWLWKGYSPDNPDYSHVYKNESYSHRSLSEYNDYMNLLDDFAEEIIEEMSPGSDLPALTQVFNSFRVDLKDKLKKYFMAMSQPSATSAPSASAEDERAELTPPVDAEPFDSTADSDIAAAYEDGAGSGSGGGNFLKITEKVIDSLNRLEEPNSSWLTNNRRVKMHKVPALIAWLAKEDINPTNDFEAKKSILKKLNLIEEDEQDEDKINNLIANLNLKTRFFSLASRQGKNQQEIGQLYNKLTNNKFINSSADRDVEGDDVGDTSLFNNILSHLNDDEAESIPADDESNKDLESSEEPDGDSEPEPDTEPNEVSNRLSIDNFKDLEKQEIINKLKNLGYELDEKVNDDGDFLNNWQDNLIKFRDDNIKLEELIYNLNSIISRGVRT